MKSVDLAPTVQDRKADGPQTVIWDGATGHNGPEVEAIGLSRIKLSPILPALNPDERVFEYSRDRIEGQTYNTIDEKVAKVEEVLTELAADLARVQSITGLGVYRDQPQFCSWSRYPPTFAHMKWPFEREDTSSKRP
jgi:hypothetical protein